MLLWPRPPLPRHTTKSSCLSAGMRKVALALENGTHEQRELLHVDIAAAAGVHFTE